MPSKRYYTISEVSEMLTLPAETLRYWEKVFPMFKPHRTVGGQRRFSRNDVRLAEFIKNLLYVKGLKADAAIEIINKTFRKSAPRRNSKCRDTKEAIALLEEVRAVTVDAHALNKIDAVIMFLNPLGNGGKSTV